jgi:hypothetical protein
MQSVFALDSEPGVFMIKKVTPPAGACLRSLRARGKVLHRTSNFKV